mmetsp:Transcript_5967/g.14535  ORF Transcript_5967/g.14535 Transcript_5967/m.14535 type:complete len:255 (-) Transcript_5967:73-837(-)
MRVDTQGPMIVYTQGPMSVDNQGPIIGRRTKRPRRIERNVAIAYPNTPTRRAGTTRTRHFLAAAIPAAVVGPPTLALLARRSSFHQTDSRKLVPVLPPEEDEEARAFCINGNARRPRPRRMPRWIARCTKLNDRIAGPEAMTIRMLPAAPVAAKNSCMNITPAASPAPLRDERGPGMAVAAAIVINVAIGIDHPEMPAAMPIWFAPQQIVAETASAADISRMEKASAPSSSITTPSVPPSTAPFLLARAKRSMK